MTQYKECRDLISHLMWQTTPDTLEINKYTLDKVFEVIHIFYDYDEMIELFQDVVSRMQESTNILWYKYICDKLNEWNYFTKFQNI